MSFLHVILLMIGTVTCASAADQSSSSSDSNGSTFSFAHDGFTASSLRLINNHATVSSGILTLDGRSSFAGALYKEPISFLDPASGNSTASFSSSFTFSSDGNGSLAFVISPDLNLTDYNEAILFNSGTALSSSKGLEVAFNLWYTNEIPVLDEQDPYYSYWQATDLEYLLLLVELVDGSSRLFSQIVDTPASNQSYQQPAACSPAQSGSAHENPLYQYQVSVQYNASACLFSAVFGLCPYNDLLVYYAASLNLSDSLTNSMFVGFIATNKGSYNVSQWNFTTNPTSAASVDSRSSSSSKIREGYVLGFSLMGLGIAALIILAVGAFWFWRKMKKARRLNVVTPYVCASFATADPAIAMATNIELNTVPDPPTHVEQHNTVPGAASSPFQVSATASWLKPPTPR